MMSPTAVFVTTDLFFPLSWPEVAARCSGTTWLHWVWAFSFSESDSPCTQQYEDNNEKHSIDFLWKHYTTLLHFLNLGFPELRAAQFNFTLLDSHVSLSLSLSRENFINSFFFPVVGICGPSLVRGKKENTAKVNIVFPNGTLSVLRGMWEG